MTKRADGVGLLIVGEEHEHARRSFGPGGRHRATGWSDARALAAGEWIAEFAPGYLRLLLQFGHDLARAFCPPAEPP